MADFFIVVGLMHILALAGVVADTVIKDSAMRWFGRVLWVFGMFWFIAAQIHTLINLD